MAMRAPFLYVGKNALGAMHQRYTDADLKRYKTPSEFVLCPGNYEGYFTANSSTGCAPVASEINALVKNIAALAKRVSDTPYTNGSVHKYKVWIGTPFFGNFNLKYWNVSKETDLTALRSGLKNIGDAIVSYVNQVKAAINNIAPSDPLRFDMIVAGFYMNSEDMGGYYLDMNDPNDHPMYKMYKQVSDHVGSSAISPVFSRKRMMWSPIYSIDTMISNIAKIVHKSSIFDLVLIQPADYPFGGNTPSRPALTGCQRVLESVANQRVRNRAGQVVYNSAPPRATIGVQMEVDTQYFNKSVCRNFYDANYLATFHPFRWNYNFGFYHAHPMEDRRGYERLVDEKVNQMFY